MRIIKSNSLHSHEFKNDFYDESQNFSIDVFDKYI